MRRSWLRRQHIALSRLWRRRGSDRRSTRRRRGGRGLGSMRRMPQRSAAARRGRLNADRRAPLWAGHGRSLNVDETLRLRSPMVDRLQVETPVTAHLEGRQFPSLDQPIDRGGMNTQVVRDLFERHHVDHSLNCIHCDNRRIFPMLTLCELKSTDSEQTRRLAGTPVARQPHGGAPCARALAALIWRYCS
jgi:hypothetical protein